MAHRLLITFGACGVLLAGCGAASRPSARSLQSSARAANTRDAATAPTASGAGTGAVMGFEGVPIEPGAPIAPASSTGRAPVDGIRCAPAEQLAYHIHVHLAVFLDGRSRSLPGGIGIPGSRMQQTSQGPVAVAAQTSCFYWLHTHAPDGIIHIESPTRRIYTLGEFFDEWRQPLTSSRIGTIAGSQSWLVDGRPWRRSPRAIPLRAHTAIQLSVGRPVVAFQPVDWSRTGL